MKEIKIKDVDVIQELVNAPDPTPRKKYTKKELDRLGKEALRKFLSQRGMLNEEMEDEI
jgi:hypothetical protein